MSAGVSLSRHSGDPVRLGKTSAHHLPIVPVVTLDEEYRPIAEPVPTTEMMAASRRIKRLTETREIRVRTTHKRRKVITRGGVLASFGLAMIVYPVMGNVVPYASTAVNVPGVVLGETPTTGHALLGDGPALIPTIIALPTVDEKAAAIAASDPQYILSTRLPDCQPPPVYGTENGRLTEDELCLLWDGSYLRADAALAFDKLNEAFNAKFGRDICIYEGYRSYEDQIRMKALRGYLAAPPGLSMHGLGIAFDLCIGDYSGAPKEWLDSSAAAFGYVNPDWAKYRKFEPWHWEFKPATDQLGVYDGDYYGGGVADGGDSAAPGSPVTGTDTAPNPQPTTGPAPTPAPNPTPAPGS